MRIRNLHGLFTTVRRRISTEAAFSYESPECDTALSLSSAIPALETRQRRNHLAWLLKSSPTGNPVRYYQSLHAQIEKSKFQGDVFLSNLLLPAYGRCHRIKDARKVFDGMPVKSLVSWSALTSIYAQHGLYDESLRLLMEFNQGEGARPTEYILASVAHACARMGDLSQGTQVHCVVIKSGFDGDVFVGTSLVDFYAKIGLVDDARLVFDGLLEKSEVTWTTMISGSVRNGMSESAVQLLEQMRHAGVFPSVYVLSSVLSACSNLKFIDGAKQIHAHVLRRETEMDALLVNVLIDCYTKCGLVRVARKVFDRMNIRNMISWTTMISGYMQNSHDREALMLFREMTVSGWKPDEFACTSILTSCGSLKALGEGKQVHAYVIKTDLEIDEFVRNGLIDMYAKCNLLDEARLLFDLMRDHNVISYNAIIEGYSSQGKLQKALELFHEMRLESLQPSHLTFVSILGASAALLILNVSKQVHGLIVKYGISLNLLVGSALIDAYAKCYFLYGARLLFEDIGAKDIVVWNAMMFGYAQQMENEETIKLFSQLQSTSLEKPNEHTFAAVVMAASNLASLQHGEQLHCLAIELGLQNEPFVANALIDMYAKCGCVHLSRKLFDEASGRDVTCWNSMITTYAHNGEGEAALQVFKEMLNQGIIPNYVSYVSVLSACSHAGLIEEGLRYYRSMLEMGIEPGNEHYACVVTLLGRAGRVSEAKDFIAGMPVQPEAAVWRCLLSACREAGHLELGEYAADKAISLDPMDSGSYVLLSNIYAARGMWKDVKRIRTRMDAAGIVKEPGKSGDVARGCARGRTRSDGLWD
ncbi:hypothetical protein MLD38_021474 [Melastoma candidum]|uniref:Uncharacterized protein n=1 Tax=Melastoma candidum TaxID=119954 RepID=A0ACB9QK33_9MYRT|nr:hypothetical protein MLD38_021474 [Melastoma candidum]